MEHGRGETRMKMTNHEMSPDDRRRMTLEHHQATIWVPVLTATLGLWLASSPAMFSYRSSLHGWLDLATGLLTVALATAWLLAPLRFLLQWTIALIGFWLLMAPLVFWAGAPEFVVDTFVGALLIACSILIADMPGMMMVMKPGPEVPPGWSYNPSSWLQRAPIIALAIISFFASRYLAAFQLGHIGSVWDPFFADGTRRVLTSEVSRAWPISDAGLGSISYALEALMGFMGGQDRWRSMPWMVTFFGILVVPLGAVSIILVILQPVSVGAWCTLCLLTAALMLVMIPLTLDEVWAMGEFLVRSHRAGKPFWRTFFLGDTIESGAKQDSRIPAFGAPLTGFSKAMLWGVSVPWNFLVSTAAGLWLMFAPAAFGTTSSAADADHLLGALIVTGSVIVLAEVARPFRWLNGVLGLAVAVSPLLFSGTNLPSMINDAVVGVAVIALNFPRGKIKESYGLWSRYLGSRVAQIAEPRARKAA
jgi:hypothetical protein